MRSCLCFALLLLLPRALAAAEAPRATLAFEGPAYVDMPIWVRVTLPDTPNLRLVQANLRYPLSEIPWGFDGHSFEVRRDGKPLPSLKVQWRSGSTRSPSPAPSGSPAGRLPLHLLYPFDQPGKYLVKYEYEAQPDGPGPPPAIRAESDWIELEVKPFSAQQREAWLSEKLAHPPRDEGLLVGDYLPSLLAHPDDRVLGALTTCFYRPERFVQEMAVYSLDYYPGATVAAVVPKVLHEKGPFRMLSFLPLWRPDWFRPVADRLAEAALPYLDSDGAETVGSALGTLTVLEGHRISFHGPARARADAAIWDHLDHLLTFREPIVLAPLLNFVGVERSARAREAVWKIADRPDARPVRQQALLTAAVLGDPRDLPRLGALLATGDAAVTGLPSQLRITWGDQATPYLIAGLHSPNPDTRLPCACELSLGGHREGFSYLLAIVEGPDGQAAVGVMGFMIDHLGLRNGALQPDAVALLKAKLEPK